MNKRMNTILLSAVFIAGCTTVNTTIDGNVNLNILLECKMTQDNGMDIPVVCQSCELAGEWCPSGMMPESPCPHRRPTQESIAKSWWNGLGDKDIVHDSSMFDD